MRYVFSAILLMSAALAMYLSTRIIYNKSYKRMINVLFSVTAFASGLWSFGYAGMLFTENEKQFIYFRAFGMIGLLAFLITCQLMLFLIAEYKIKKFGLITAEAVAGIIILAIVINPDCIEMQHTANGIVTAFLNPVLSLIYTGYTLFVAVCYTVIVIKILRSGKKKRIRDFGKKFLMVESIVVLGMIVDTVLPAFGINFNIPASTILQFVSLELIYYAIHKINRNAISIQNMTGYIYHSLKLPVLIFDSDNRLRVYNNKAKELFGFLEEKDGEYDFWKSELSIDKPDSLDGIHETVNLEAVYEKKNMNLNIYLDSIHDDYDDYLGYIVSINDVTAMVNNMIELNEIKDKALEANRAKSLFLANMSHEIRTPMNSILGFSELALKDDIEPATREYFEDIHSSASVLLATINDILDISKIESGKMELLCDDYTPARMLKEVGLIIGMQAEQRKLSFEMDIAPDFPNVINGDKPKIREILINLLNNSVKYTNTGKVMLRASFIKGENEEGIAKFEIEDTGIGIKEEDIDSIFSIFQRVDLAYNKNTEGTGLGLSITKGYVDLMGGEISVSSTYGVGTKFTVLIPHKVVDSSNIKFENDEKDETSRQLKFRDIKILAVDDTKVNIKVISKVLVRYGIDIDVAYSGADSIELCKSNSYDIVLMDQMMPVMDGIEAMRHIRELGGGYEMGGKNKIIALTANAIAGTKEILVREGFDDYLGKPINFKVFEQVITDILPADKYYYE